MHILRDATDPGECREWHTNVDILVVTWQALLVDTRLLNYADKAGRTRHNTRSETTARRSSESP